MLTEGCLALGIAKRDPFLQVTWLTPNDINHHANIAQNIYKFKGKACKIIIVAPIITYGPSRWKLTSHSLTSMSFSH